MKKKLIALVLTAVMVTASMTGCGNKTEPAAPSNDAAATDGATVEDTATAEVQDVKLTVWGPQEDQVKSDTYANGFLAAMCEQFNEAHPEYNITFEYGVCGEDVAKDEVTKDVAAAADVYMYANDQLPILVDAGAIMEIGGTNVDTIKEMAGTSMTDSVTYQGGVYGVPYTSNTWFMFYDKSKFDESEVGSLETMLAKDLGDGVTNVCFPLTNSWNIAAFYYASGLTMFGEDGTDGAAGCKFDGPEGVAVTKYLVDLAANPKFTVQTNEENGKGISMFEEGKLGAFFTGSWDAANIQAALGENYACAKIPTIELNGKAAQMKSFAGSKAMGVNPTTTEKGNAAAAVALAIYLGSPEVQLARYNERSVPPIAAEGIDDVMIKAIADEISNASVAQPLVKEMNNWWAPAEAMGKAIAGGEVTLDNAEEKTKTMVNNINNPAGL